MEKQREKRIKICTQSESASFPIDIISEILLRLPEKSVARSRCVSKLWLSISTDPYFINQFETRNPRPSLVLCYTVGEKLYVSLVRQHHHTLWNSKKPDSSSQLLDLYHMELSKLNCDDLRPMESVHGLVCFTQSETPIVWNPSTRQLKTLPKPRKSWKRLKVMLGYDPIECKHKVVCLPLSRSSDVCRVLTLGSAQESWRTVNTKYRHRSEFFTSGRCIKGVLYYIAYVFRTRAYVLMRFDVRSENFDMIQLPSDIYKEPLITYEGRLACLKPKITTQCGKKKLRMVKNEITLYILEDAEQVQRKWTVKGFRAPMFHHDKNSYIRYMVKGITPAGEFIYVKIGSWFRNSCSILFFDPLRKSFRRLELKGTADVNNYGIHNASELYALPNHVESQMPL